MKCCLDRYNQQGRSSAALWSGHGQLYRDTSARRAPPVLYRSGGGRRLQRDNRAMANKGSRREPLRGHRGRGYGKWTQRIPTTLC